MSEQVCADMHLGLVHIRHYLFTLDGVCDSQFCNKVR